MKILFMGTPEFAVKSLEAIVSEKIFPTAIVTTPDKQKGRGLKFSSSAVKEKSLELNIPILQPENLKDENFISDLKILDIDLIIVVAFRFLPKEILSIPKIGVVNLHASLLPKFRGAAPINWAIINGEGKTGVTTFFINEKIDSGKILFQSECEINFDDNAGSLHDKLAILGADLLVKTIQKISSSDFKSVNQNENQVSLAPKIFKKDCKINWQKSNFEIYNFIRGLSPYPAAWTLFNHKILKIFKANICAENLCEILPGKLFANKNQLFVSTNNGFLEILELQLEGGNRISSNEFLRGYKIEQIFLK